jgi:hypothetical protein
LNNHHKGGELHIKEMGLYTRKTASGRPRSTELTKEEILERQEVKIKLDTYANYQKCLDLGTIIILIQRIYGLDTSSVI